MSVILQPSYALAFNRPFIKNVMRPLYITNPNADPIQFKIKTNAPMLYAVRPNQGRVNPGKAVEVLVMLRAKEEEPPLDVKCRNKFLVQSILISPEKTSVPLVELWSTLPIRSHKLRVNYLPPEGHPLDSSGHPTTVPGATLEPPLTDPPSKLEQLPERSSNGASPSLVPPDTEPTSATRVAPAHRSDIVSPPESPLTALIEEPPALNSVSNDCAYNVSHPPEFFSRVEMEYAADATLPVQQSDGITSHGTDERQLLTDISSQREEAFAYPMIFDPHRYVARRTSRKTKSSSPNSVFIDHTSSFLMATGTLPMNVDGASSTGTTIPPQDKIGPCEEGAAILVTGSRSMEDRLFGHSSEGMQSAWQPCVAEPITFSDPEPVSTGASSSNFWDVPSSDVPLPRPQEVGWPMRIQRVPSDHHDAGNSDGYSSGAFFGYDTGTDEPRPLPQPLTTFIKCALNHGQTQSAQSGFILASLNEDLVLPVPTRQFTSVDWQEFSLPDGTHYFANSTLHTITDVDLRNTEKLDAVTRFLDRCDKEDLPPPEWELWLRDGGEPTTLFIPHRAWIHHGSRMVVFERPPGISKDVDKIESEYQYWLFMGSHPLHTPLPPGSIDKAINALAWFYASPLKLSSHHRPSPFSQEECQELLTQLRSFSHTPTHSVSLVRTLVVSTTLGRIVAWRQGRRWDGATFQGPRKNNNTPSAGISLFRTASDPFFWSGLPGVPWNDHIIPVSAREVVCGVLLLVLSLSVTIALAFLIWMRDR